MTYNLVKTNIPQLVDRQFAMKIAKINNIDYATGLALSEPLKPPSQFELLCGDIKESIFLFIRKNIMMLLIVTIIIILLTIRYYQVQKDKKAKADKLKQHEKMLKKQTTDKLLNQTTNPLLNQNIEQPNEIEILRNSFSNYDDTKIKNTIMNKINQNNNHNKINFNYATYPF